jgi:hypothetical protein
LKARQAALCGDNRDTDGIAALFAKDAVWDSPACESLRAGKTENCGK